LEREDTIRNVLFDLDETVYPKDTGLMDLVSRRITEYMSERMGIDPETVSELRLEYYERYGTTGRGLFLHHDFDVEDYFRSAIGVDHIGDGALADATAALSAREN